MKKILGWQIVMKWDSGETEVLDLGNACIFQAEIDAVEEAVRDYELQVLSVEDEVASDA